MKPESLLDDRGEIATIKRLSPQDQLPVFCKSSLAKIIGQKKALKSHILANEADSVDASSRPVREKTIKNDSAAKTHEFHHKTSHRI